MTTSTAPQVIYARVPGRIKAGAAARARENHSTLTTAVVDLLERGLTNAQQERSVNELQANLERVEAERYALEAQLRAARTELSAVRSLAQRAARPVGTCPNCKKPISGYDLLGTGQCPNCTEDLSTLLVPKTMKAPLDQREVLILVGALSAVLGVAYLASK